MQESHSTAEKATDGRTEPSHAGTNEPATQHGRCPNCSGQITRVSRAGPDTVQLNCCGVIVDERYLSDPRHRDVAAGCNCQHLPPSATCAYHRANATDSDTHDRRLDPAGSHNSLPWGLNETSSQSDTPVAAYDSGDSTSTTPAAAAHPVAVYYRVDGVSPDDVGDPFREIANEIFHALREHHGDAIEGVIPVVNEEFDPRLGDTTPQCTATGCEQPVDHVIHGVRIDGTEFAVPTCGGHDEYGPDSDHPNTDDDDDSGTTPDADGDAGDAGADDCGDESNSHASAVAATRRRASDDDLEAAGIDPDEFDPEDGAQPETDGGVDLSWASGAGGQPGPPGSRSVVRDFHTRCVFESYQALDRWRQRHGVLDVGEYSIPATDVSDEPILTAASPPPGEWSE